MGREDQTEEREVLDSIFPDEITDLSETSYRISISLETPENDVEQSEDSEQPIIYLEVSYPEEYPDVAPGLSISSPPNAPKHPRLDIQEDRDQLLESLQETIEENMGMAMVFTLVSALKESAENLMVDRANAVQVEHEKAAAKAEEAENAKFRGTPVNRETFLEWMAKFQKEIADEELRLKEEKEAEDKKKKGPKEEKKLTGRQLWERGLAGKGDYDEEDGEDAMPAVDKLKVST